MEDIASLIATDQIQVEITIRLGGTQLSVAELARLRPDDILYRRTKHYLHLTEDQRREFAEWFDRSDLAQAA